MQANSWKPGRRGMLTLAVLLTLAPAGVGLRQLVAPEDGRTAATIADLADDYEGLLWSNRNTDFQNVPGTLVVTSRVRTRFTGTLTVDEGEPQSIPVTGGVSASGRVSLNGAINEQNFRIRVNITGQLSAAGNAIVGTYSVTGRDESGPVNDRGTLVLLDNPPNN